jgi:hypothetical protein
MYHINGLGTLFIDEIFVYYDEPRLYTCKDTNNRRYLINWLGRFENYNKWLYLPINFEELLKLKDGEITLREFYENPESEYVWTVKQYNDDSLDEVSLISIKDLTDDDLPDKDSYLK